MDSQVLSEGHGFHCKDNVCIHVPFTLAIYARSILLFHLILHRKCDESRKLISNTLHAFLGNLNLLDTYTILVHFSAYEECKFTDINSASLSDLLEFMCSHIFQKSIRNSSQRRAVALTNVIHHFKWDTVLIITFLMGTFLLFPFGCTVCSPNGSKTDVKWSLDWRMELQYF